jgi:hypothetical protein
MPLQQLKLTPGINREITSYSAEGGWYECDKVRFRSGFPEKIGGWTRISTATFQGVCRALFNWITLDSELLTGVGTNLKYYVERGGAYNDITPIRATESLTDPFETTSGSPIVVVTDAASGFVDGDFVTFSGASAVGGITLDGEYQLTFITATTYSVTADSNATSSATGGGSVTAVYQINTGPAFSVPVTGWGAGAWGAGPWGVGSFTAGDLEDLRLWSQGNFGEDLVFGPRGGGLYYWDASSGFSTRGVLVSSLSGASNVPTVQNYILISDTSRFVFCFGANELGSSVQDPLLVRWSDQEDVTNWTPAATNQAGGIRFSQGSEIVTAKQSRQEVLVWTDSALYSMQYVGAGGGVWSTQLLGSNISIASQNSVAIASNISFWMGLGKFYMYDGRVQPLPCAVKRYVFDDFNETQFQQVHAGTNEEFNEVWWFYCSADSTEIDRYVVYNYVQNIWYYGTMGRTAWLDSDLRTSPIAATYNYNIVAHEDGVDNNETGTPQPISAYITSAQFDIDSGDRFSFIWRVLPDLTFNGSTAEAPAATMTLLPLANSGSGYNSPTSEGGTNTAGVTRTSVLPVEQYTGQVYTRVRGRQMAVKVESAGLGVQWQLGVPRIDIRPDGRR